MSDFVINPRVGHIRWDEVARGEELMAAGYEAGLDSIPQLRALIDSVRDEQAQKLA
jgi:predicted acylesterase/phospholipase RssA